MEKITDEVLEEIVLGAAACDKVYYYCKYI